MNKLLIGIMLVGGLVAQADAAITVEQRRERCNMRENSVWEPKSATCIQRFKTCSSSDAAERAHCNKMFAGIQLGTQSDGFEIVQMYLDKTRNTKAATKWFTEPGITGQDYIAVLTNHGEYIEFEFDDLSETSNSTAQAGYDKAIEIINREVQAKGAGVLVPPVKSESAGAVQGQILVPPVKK